MMNAGLIARTGLETHSDNTIMPRSPHRYRQPFIEASRAANRSVRRVERDNTIPAPVDCSNFRAAPQEERHCLTSWRKLADRTCPMTRNRLLLASVVVVSISWPGAPLIAGDP